MNAQVQTKEYKDFIIGPGAPVIGKPREWWVILDRNGDIHRGCRSLQHAEARVIVEAIEWAYGAPYSVVRVVEAP
jgi:hypothetical protein